MVRGETTLEVRLRPSARKSQIEGFRDGVLHAMVKEPPREGRANRALISLMAEALGLPKGSISIIRGLSNRDKVVAVSGLSPEELAEKLARASVG
jgi:uncharacterized protein YggU (UPF0235/DUF167 family)